MHFVLGLINSRLVSFYWLQRFYDNKETFPKIKKQPLHSIPIRKCARQQQKPIIDLVKKIRITKSNDPTADTKDLERQIDVLVYELYGLTPEDIQVIDESTAR